MFTSVFFSSLFVLTKPHLRHSTLVAKKWPNSIAYTS